MPSSTLTPKGHTPWENVGKAMNLNCAIIQSDFTDSSDSVPRRTIQDTNCPYYCVTTFWSLLLEERYTFMTQKLPSAQLWSDPCWCRTHPKDLVPNESPMNLTCYESRYAHLWILVVRSLPAIRASPKIALIEIPGCSGSLGVHCMEMNMTLIFTWMQLHYVMPTSLIHLLLICTFISLILTMPLQDLIQDK